MQNYKFLYKDYLKKTVFESTDLEEGFFLDKIKNKIKNSKTVKGTEKFMNDWFGSYYQKNVHAVESYLKKCITNRCEIKDIINFTAENYKISGTINNFEILISKELLESVNESLSTLFEDEDEEELKALLAQADELKKKIALKGADEDNYQAMPDNHNSSYYNSDDGSEVDDSVKVFSTDNLKNSKGDEWIRIDTTHLGDTLKKMFPQDYKEVHSKILRILSLVVQNLITKGLKKNPVKGRISKEITPDTFKSNKCFKFDLSLSYEAIDEEKANKAKIGDNEEDDGVIPAIVDAMQENPDEDSGELKMYNLNWAFSMEVMNTDDIIKYEKESKQTGANPQGLINFQNKRKEIYNTIISALNMSFDSESLDREISKLTTQLSKEESKKNVETVKEIKKQLKDKRSLKVSTEDQNAHKQSIFEIKDLLDSVFKNVNLKQILTMTPDQKQDSFRKIFNNLNDIKSEMDTKVQSTPSITQGFILGIRMMLEDLEELLNSLESEEIKPIEVETPEEIEKRAKQGLLKWLSPSKVEDEDLQTDGDTNRYSKDLIVGRRDNPLSPIIHFEIELTPNQV